MIQHVRSSFIKITMSMLTFVLILPLCALNVVTSALTYNQTKNLLEQIAQTEIYILQPKKLEPAHNEHPTEEANMGVGKHNPPHTTPSETTTITTTTTETSSKTIYTTTVTTAVQAVHPYAQTTVPPTNPPETKPTQTEPTPQSTQPQMTHEQPQFTWGTRPTEPMRTEPQPPAIETYPAWTKPPHNAWWGERENDYEADEHDPWRQWGAVTLPAARLRSASALAAVLVQGTQSSTPLAETLQTTAPTETTNTLTVAQTRMVHKKFLNFDRKPSQPPPKNQASNLDHFVVYLNETGAVTEVHGTEDYNTQSSALLIETIDDEYDGYCGSLQFVRKDYAQGAVVVFSDRQSDITMQKNLLLVSVGVFILMEGIVFVLTRILTKRAMRPMEVSLEKQRQFISDAGHELKTPLTIISANADILADEIGDNKWLTYIKSQAERMRILVQEMMDLMKISNNTQHLAQSHFNIDSLIENVALPFECQAFEQKKTFHIELEPNVEFFGNTEQIRRMVGIFIDNAFKYSNENGTIQIQLKTENGRKVLKIYNTGIGIEKGEEEKIFERFYRSDSSRARQSEQGGYGLGLAIAKSIADQHQIKIQVLTEPGQWISFNLWL